MPILLIRRHFLLAHQAFKNHTGDRTHIPYLTQSEYRFLFEGISLAPKSVEKESVSCIKETVRSTEKSPTAYGDYRQTCMEQSFS